MSTTHLPKLAAFANKVLTKNGPFYSFDNNTIFYTINFMHVGACMYVSLWQYLTWMLQPIKRMLLVKFKILYKKWD
jgi:hypothetical protein